MARASIAVLFLGLCVAPTAADEILSAKTLAATKLATVFLKTEAKGIIVSGSGFVVKKDGDVALIVTNLHVVAPKLKIDIEPDRTLPRPPRVVGKIRPRIIRPAVPTSPAPRTVVLTLKDAVVTAVFGSGTADERSARTEIVAVDPENDLAILKVTGVKNLPAPIVFEKSTELIETTTVYAFGFPFGSLLSTNKGSPAITVGKAAISSLRTNDQGELAIVQIDGSLNPGNSGGPIVDT
ncbi:MAG TPA: serine protease [Gemmataceae bacterium]|jgi:S1-C subfamily serine protease|nr:serine protease [Gemmataceae bacterium]